MSEVFLMRHGGGGGIGNAYALIAVSYPVGSSCTCSKGTKTLKATGKVGAFCFAIPEAGDWVISIKDSDHEEATRTVTISSEGQVEKLRIDYENALFNNGVGKENWSTAAEVGGTASVGDTLHLFGNGGSPTFGNRVGWAYTTQALSLSGKRSLAVVASTSFSGTLSTAGRAQVRVVEESGTYASSPAAAPDRKEGNAATTTLDISGLDSAKKYRIVFMASGNYFDDQQGTVSTLTTTVDVTSVTAT